MRVSGNKCVVGTVAGVLLALVSGGATAGAQDAAGFARAKHLGRGINLSMWYAQERALYNATGGAEKLASYTTPADFKVVRDLGFDDVRLSIDPVPLIADAKTGTLRPEAMARLDATVRQITATGLVVILDIHPEKEWERSVMAAEGQEQLFAFWKSFAQHYAHTDPTKVYFELMNEPEGKDSNLWAAEQVKLAAVVRAQAPEHTIIATGAEWGGMSGLMAIEPLQDDNIIYSFHDYNPMEFTHQGATWSTDSLKPLRGVPYPSSPEAVAPLLPAMTNDAAKMALERYGQQHWSATTMTKEISEVVAWAQARHVPLFCGEFGVYAAYAPAIDRARWIGEMRKTLEKDGIGWNMWDYHGGFGLVTKKDGVTTVDKGLADALGVGEK